jgi:hypothetical protein
MRPERSIHPETCNLSGLASSMQPTMGQGSWPLRSTAIAREATANAAPDDLAQALNLMSTSSDP